MNGSTSAGAELSQEQAAHTDVVDDMEKTKIEDESAPETSA